MTQLAARRGHQYDFASTAPSYGALAKRTTEQPCARNIAGHHVLESLWRHVNDRRDIVESRPNYENVDATEAIDASVHDRVAVGFRIRTSPDYDNFSVCGCAATRGRSRFQFDEAARGKHEASAGCGKNSRRKRAKGTGSARYDGYLTSYVKQLDRVVEDFAHFVLSA
jgi:hypothetical protein